MTLPKPSPSAHICVSFTMAIASPKRSGKPMSDSGMAPISNSSIAQATVEPRVIGSMPCSLQMKLALTMAEMSLTPQAAP